MKQKELLGRLQRHRWRMTPQRRVIAEVLAGEHVHLTAEEVLEQAVARLPEISRATVYNALSELVRLGEVLEISADGRSKRYDPNARDPHQHLVCHRCGAIRDVHPEGETHLSVSAEERQGFVVSGVEIVFRGLCARCTGKRGPQSRVRRRPRRS